MKNIAMVACAAVGLLMPCAASAVTYDAFTSFNGTNPAGNFFYNGATSPTTATPLAPSALCPLSTICLEGGAESGVYKATAGTPNSNFDSDDNSTTAIPHDQLLVQPGDFAAAILFIAPTAGLYTFNASFTSLSDAADGILVLRLTGVPMGIPGVMTVGSANFIPNQFTFTEDRALNAGDFYGFRIGVGAHAGSDITGFNFSATTSAPEPATWGLMLMGFGGLGATLRRRRAQRTVLAGS